MYRPYKNKKAEREAYDQLVLGESLLPILFGSLFSSGIPIMLGYYGIIPRWAGALGFAILISIFFIVFTYIGMGDSKIYD